MAGLRALGRAVDLPVLKSTYLLDSTDSGTVQPVPTQYDNCLVTPLVDGQAFFRAVYAALQTVGKGTAAENAARDEYVLIANWRLALDGGRAVPPPYYAGGSGMSAIKLHPFMIDASDGSVVLAELLKTLSVDGVDVRVLGWVHRYVMQSDAMMKLDGSIAGVNAQTLAGLRHLRTEPTLAARAVMNTINHPVGAAHTKLIVVGNKSTSVGFTTGMDFVSNRWADSDHDGSDDSWHDIGAQVQGRAVQGLYDFFRAMWQENIARAPFAVRFDGEALISHSATTPDLAARTLPTVSAGTHTVQSLRTVPVVKYRGINVWNRGVPAISFAPSGAFEVRAGWRKAILAATRFVYMEDQSFWSAEVMRWLNVALNASPQLHVLLVMSGGGDPDDPAFPEQKIHTQAINHALLDGLGADQLKRVAAFQRFGSPDETDSFTVTAVTVNADGSCYVSTDYRITSQLLGNAWADGVTSLKINGTSYPVIGNDPVPDGGGSLSLTVTPQGAHHPLMADQGVISSLVGVTVHAKTTIVDDHWAIIGSANCMRRSLYTDLEHSIGFVDADDTAVQSYRATLWAEHLAHPQPAELADLDVALNAWVPTWGTVGGTIARPATLVPVSLPFPEVPMTDSARELYDQLLDAQSTTPWGFVVPPTDALKSGKK